MGDREALGNSVKKNSEYLEKLYRVYEFADGLCFPNSDFRCGRLENYVNTGVLTEEDLKKILNNDKGSLDNAVNKA